MPAVLTLYGGAFYTLVTAPPETVTEESCAALAAAIVRGALGARLPGDAAAGPVLARLSDV